MGSFSLEFSNWNKPVKALFFCSAVSSVFTPVNIFDQFILEKKNSRSAETVVQAGVYWSPECMQKYFCSCYHMQF